MFFQCTTSKRAYIRIYLGFCLLLLALCKLFVSSYVEWLMTLNPKHYFRPFHTLSTSLFAKHNCLTPIHLYLFNQLELNWVSKIWLQHRLQPYNIRCKRQFQSYGFSLLINISAFGTTVIQNLTLSIFWGPGLMKLNF